MRYSEPTLSVSNSGSKSDAMEQGENFKRECTLSREEAVYRPKVARGYLPGTGWTYGVLTEGGPVFGSFEKVSAVAELEWARIQANNGMDIARDFNLVDMIDRAWTERVTDMGHKGPGW